MSNIRKKLIGVLKQGFLLSIFAVSVTQNNLYGQIIFDNFITEEDEVEEAMEEYFELIHSAAPGTDWEKMDQASREKAYMDYLNSTKQRSNSVSGTNAAGAATVETFADGQLSGTWTEKGATNMAGNINYADFVSSTNAIYATSAGGNVWKGNLQGKTWTCLNNFFKLKGADFIKVIQKGAGKRIIVSTNDKYIYYSDDDGTTWNKSSGLSDIQSWGWILKTEMLADTANTLFFIATEKDSSHYVSLYRSTDKGMSFSRIRRWPVKYDKNLDERKYNLWAPANNAHNFAYLITPDSLYGIPNTGDTIQRICRHNLTITSDAHFTGCKSDSSICLYLYTDSNLYRSKDMGISWTTLNVPSAHSPSRVYSLSTGLNDPNRIYYGEVEAYSGLLDITSGQIVWTKVNNWTDYYIFSIRRLHADISLVGSFKATDSTEFQLICTDGGIYKSNDYLLDVLNISRSGMNNAQYYSVYTVPGNSNYIYAGSQDQGFQQANTDNGGLLTVNQFMTGDDGRTVSTDGNGFWHCGYGYIGYWPDAQNGTVYSYYRLDSVGKMWMPYIIEHPVNPAVVYMGGGKLGTDSTINIYKLSYASGQVTKENLPYDFAPLSKGKNISSIGISKIDNNYWYVLTNNGKFFYSSDGGNSFSMNTDSAFAGITGLYYYGSSIFVSRMNLGTIYIAGSGYSSPGVYKSTDHGRTFAPLIAGLPPTLVYDITANDDETMIFAGTEVGPYVYVAADSGWYPMRGTTAPDQIYWDVEFISQKQKVRFATYGRGIQDFDIVTDPTSVTVAPGSNAAVTDPIIYPNPASGTLTVKGIQVNASDVRVDINNIMGENLISASSLTAGSANEVSLNIETLLPGQYFVIVRTNEEVKTARFIKQ